MPKLIIEDYNALKRVLTHCEWITGEFLSARSGVPLREIRRIAGLSGDIISGQKGYRWAADATAEEILHAKAHLLSMADQLQRRAASYDKHLDTKDMFAEAVA